MRAWKNNCGIVAHLVLVIGCLAISPFAFSAKEDAQVTPPMPPMPMGGGGFAPEGAPALDKKPNFPSRPSGTDDAALDFEPGLDPALNFPPPRDMGRDNMPPGPSGRADRRSSGRRMPPSRSSGRGQQNAAQMAQEERELKSYVPEHCTPAKGRFEWNFEDEKLSLIIRQVADLLCRNIINPELLPENVKATIIGKTKLSPKDSWNVLMAILANKGFAMVQQVEGWMLVKRNEAKSYATPLYLEAKSIPQNEEVGTFFYKVQHASQEVLKNSARALMSKDGMVESVGDQYVIMIDSNSNLRRLADIFGHVDIEDAINKVHILTLKHADARTVEKQLRDLFDVAGSAGGPRGGRRKRSAGEGKAALEIDKIIADERTNSLIVVSDKESMEKLKEIAGLIDQPATDQTSKGKIHVKKLKFADAKKVAETLSAVVSQGKGSRYPRRRPEEGSHELFEGDVKITAHETTNTLVTVASANDYRALLATINKLDVRREQVYVEAVILDVQVNDNNDFGINIFSGMEQGFGSLGTGLGIVANPGGRAMAQGVKDTLVAGAAGSNVTGLGSQGIGALAVLGNFMSGGVAALVGPKIGDTQIPSFGAVLQAFSTSGHVDVLSTPYLLTTDNQEAVMTVGEKIPVLRGTSSVGGGLGGALGGVPFQNVSNEDVKLTFKITPHVGADDNVRLDVDQEVNELGSDMEILNQKHYRIRTKSAKTTLVLKDQQTGVIGGLIQHKTTTNENKVPFLGDIPILGWLFKNSKKINDRRSLLLILTPYVIRTDDDYKKIVERKLKEREEFAKMYYGGKIKNYNKYIDYDKKAGPVSSLLLQVENEMGKVENGGPGDGSELTQPVLPSKEPVFKDINQIDQNKSSGAENKAVPLPTYAPGLQSRAQRETARMGEDFIGAEDPMLEDFVLEDFDGNVEDGLIPEVAPLEEGSVD